MLDAALPSTRGLGLALLLLAGILVAMRPAAPAGGSAAMVTDRPEELLEATIPELQAALTAGRVTSRELVTLYLARIAAYDQQGPALNAVSALSPDAIAQAEALDAERRDRGPRGPLHGIPIIVKDNYETADMQTAAGSVLLKGWIPPADATLVVRLRAAGAIIIGKATMHELAWSWENYGSLFGQTRNPYALDRVPGGSSGGTGAAVAAGFAVAGMGSDTCGSVRVPAAHNNLVGLRPTQGLLSRAGIIPLSHTQDTGGPMTRTVTDTAVLLDILAGPDPADPTTSASAGHITPYAAALRADGLQGARIGIITDLLGTDPEEAAVTAVMGRAAEELRAAGAEVIAVSLPELMALIAPAATSVIRDEFKADLNAYLAARPTAPVRDLDAIIASGQYHPGIDAVLRLTQSIDSGSAEHREKLARREQAQAAAEAALTGYRLAALAYPSVRREAVAIGAGPQSGVNCHLSAHTGLPALTVPAGFTDGGLPVGLELLGPAWSEAALLRLAYAYEQATHHRRPPALAAE